jgi:hypothetical protein
MLVGRLVLRLAASSKPGCHGHKACRLMPQRQLLSSTVHRAAAGAQADTPPLASAAFAAATPGVEQDHLDVDDGMPLSLPRKLGTEAAADSGTVRSSACPWWHPAKSCSTRGFASLWQVAASSPLGSVE